MESTDSSSTSLLPHLPPGFRFHPTDEELVVHYLRRKASSAPLPVTIITDVDLYKFDPWELPSKANFGEHEWYFFSPRDRKYPNGARPNRAATSGYWKATGTDKPVLTSGGTQRVGVKKALVFYGGRPPKGIKTNWIMHEYRLTDSSGNSRGSTSSSSSCSSSSSRPPTCDVVSKTSSLRLDDWVLCRIYKKNNSCGGSEINTIGQTLGPLRPLPPLNTQLIHKLQPHKATSTTNYGALLYNDENFFQGLLTEEGPQTNPASHVVLSSSKPEPSSMVPAAAASGVLSIKQAATLPYWSKLPPVQRFQASGNDNSSSSRDNFNGRNDGSHSIATLLDQVPQGASQQHTIHGSLGEAVFGQPYQFSGMDWSS